MTYLLQDAKKICRTCLFPSHHTGRFSPRGKCNEEMARISLLSTIMFVFIDGVDIVVVGTHSDEMNMFMNFTPAHVREVIGDLLHVYVSSVNKFGVAHLWHTLITTESALTRGHLPDNKVCTHTNNRLI